MSKFKEGDTVRITGRTDIYQVSSVMERPPLVAELFLGHQNRVVWVAVRWRSSGSLNQHAPPLYVT